MSASPEAINAKTREEQDAYFADALKYIQDKHGAENVAYAGIHRDESTPICMYMLCHWTVAAN